jgi:hypothetical protein
MQKIKNVIKGHRHGRDEEHHGHHNVRTQCILHTHAWCTSHVMQWWL